MKDFINKSLKIFIRVPLVIYFYLIIWGRKRWRSIKTFGRTLFDKLKIKEIIFVFHFLFHRYSPFQFDPRHINENIGTLVRIREGGGLATTRAGQLIALTTKRERLFFYLKNISLLGAYQARVEKVIFYSYLVLTLELNNPFNRAILSKFLEKKMDLLRGLIDRVKTINGKRWDQSSIRFHLEIFYRNSLLQAKVIKEMQLAVHYAKEPPIIKEAKRALQKGLQPILAAKGASGSYWMRGTRREVLGLFKPFDEEIQAPNNPVGPQFQGTLGLRKTRRGCRVGESAHHEVGAFVVDEFLGFGIVPRTYYASFEHTAFFLAREDRFARRSIKKKFGSFQEYVGGFVPLDRLQDEEVKSIPLDEFQLLVVLDVIIGNTDRNIGNILFGDEKIAAIDHGLCFPDRESEFSYWYWSYLQQGSEPFLQPIINLLNQFPLNALTHKLKKKCFISIDALERMRERLTLFTEAVNAGLVPKQIVDLLHPTYLNPLKGLHVTLKERALEQLKLFLEASSYTKT